MARSNAVPTLGYPSQAAAIVALNEQGVEPKEIAARIGCHRGSVHRALHEYRERVGIMPPTKTAPKPVAQPVRSYRSTPDFSYDAMDAYDPNKARLEAYLRTQRGVRKALGAASL